MKIDYSLKVIGEKKSYAPRADLLQPIINSDKRIFEIIADNSYGKTFLLNLIAYALGAEKLDDEQILPSLRESIGRYNDQDSYELNYDITLSLPDNRNLILRKTHGKEKVYHFEDSPLMNIRNLHQQVTVVYDVPTAPSERLNAVINDLGSWNQKLLNKIEGYWKCLRDIENDFNNVKDIQKIEEYERKEEEYAKNILSIQRNLEENEKSLEGLRTYKSLLVLLDLTRERKELESEKIQKEGQLKNIPKPKKSNDRDERKIDSLNEQLSRYKVQFKDLVKDFLENITSNQSVFDHILNNNFYKSRFEKIREVDFTKLISADDYVSQISHFTASIKELEDGLRTYVMQEENSKKHIIHNFLKDLLDRIDELIEMEADAVLEEITKNKATYLKTEINKKIKTFQIDDFSSLNTFLDKKPYDRIRALIADGQRTFSQIEGEKKKKGVDPEGKRYFKLVEEIDSLEGAITGKRNDFNRLKIKCADRLKISDEEKLSNSEQIQDLIASKKNSISPELLQDINYSMKSLENKIKSLEDRKVDVERNRRMNETRLELEDKKSESKYSDLEQKKIRAFVKYFQLSYKNLQSFKRVIESLNSTGLDRLRHKEDVEFLKIAGKIIAFSMNNRILRPDGEYIELHYYDLLKKEFHCENDIIIKKEDISTGLASANYLKQRIGNVKGDYVVILLDEIGNMEQNTLNEVIDSIKEIEEQERLVMALLTKPQENIMKVKEY